MFSKTPVYIKGQKFPIERDNSMFIKYLIRCGVVGVSAALAYAVGDVANSGLDSTTALALGGIIGIAVNFIHAKFSVFFPPKFSVFFPPIESQSTVLEQAKAAHPEAFKADSGGSL